MDSSRSHGGCWVCPKFTLIVVERILLEQVPKLLNLILMSPASDIFLEQFFGWQSFKICLLDFAYIMFKLELIVKYLFIFIIYICFKRTHRSLHCPHLTNNYA